MRRFVTAALGFVIGAATLAGGQDDLAEELQRLEEAAARLRARQPRTGRMPALNDSGHELGLFPIFDLTAARADFLPPEGRLSLDDGSEEPYFGGRSEEAAMTVGTAEELMELVRMQVEPGAWETGGAINVAGQTLLVMHSRAIVDATRRFLDERLRPGAHRCVTIETGFVDVPAALYRTLAAGAGTALTAEQQGALDAALGGGQAQRVYAGRATCFAGQQCVFRHGQQVAVSSDAGVKIAQNKASPDPVVEVVQAGGVLAVRPSVGDDTGRITLDAHVRFDELTRVETRDAGAAGEVDLPRVDTAGATTTLTVPARTWALLGAGAPEAGKVRIALVRATYLPRGGAR